MIDLIQQNDPDWNLFITGDPDYLLRATGAVIRNYCGWHIFPNITERIEKLEIGSYGKLMVPSLYVTDVQEVRMHRGKERILLDPGEYEWFRAGYILSRGQRSNAWNYYYEPGPTFLPVTNPQLVDVVMTHGYETLPEDIKQVAFELALWAQEFRAGWVKEVSSPGFRLSLNGTMGLSLSDDMQNRLANYAIGAVK